MTFEQGERMFFARAAADAGYLLAAIDGALMNADVDELPVTTLSAESGEVSGVENGVPRHSIMDQIIESRRRAVIEVVCEKGDYCGFRKRHKDTIDVMIAVSDALLSSAVRFPLPVTMIAAYCVRSLMLDKLCGCGPDA
jgi:hypothetical protein